MDQTFGYVFPAIRGLQARREYFVSMCPLRLIPKIFYFDEAELDLSAELKAQRILNRNRIPEISGYIQKNRESYVFSALTASIDGKVSFKPLGEGHASKIGMLHVPMDAKFIINDGQHRRAAIEAAVKENPELGDETIAIVFFLDIGLERCQQMFADLNRYAIRPSKSLGVLYDHRDEIAHIAKTVVFRSGFYRDIVEMEKTNLSPRSRKLLTLGSIYGGTAALLPQDVTKNREEAVKIAEKFWEEVALHFPEWAMVRDRKMAAGDVRQDFIHSHGIVIHAIGVVGRELLKDGLDSFKKLKKLAEIDWARSNDKMWEGRAMIGGRVSKAIQNVKLTTNIIKKHLNLPLSNDERKAEEAFMRSRNAAK